MITRSWIIVVCVILSLFDLPFAAAESQGHRVSFSGEVSLASKYLFQGIDYSDGNPVVQPEVSLEYRGFSLGSWLNFDLDARHVDEIDWYLGYGWEIGALSVMPGYASYQYPNRGWDPSQEVYFDASYAALLDVSLSSHYDFDAGDGAYFTLGLSRAAETPLGTFEVGSQLFYQRNYYEITGIPALEFAANYSASIGSMTITPSVSYFATWENGDFRDQSAVPSTWWFSITVGGAY